MSIALDVVGVCSAFAGIKNATSLIACLFQPAPENPGVLRDLAAAFLTLASLAVSAASV